MFFLLGGLIGLAAGLASGGNFGNLARIRFRWPLVVVLALVIKEVGVLTPLGGTPVAPVLFGLSVVVLIAWTWWHRGRVPGIWIVAVGMAMNLVAVVANLGRMPVPEPLAHRGPPQLLLYGQWGQYVVAGRGSRLDWLGDWIAFPGALGRVFPQAYSLGDLVAFAGMIVTLYLATHEVAGKSRSPITHG